MSPRRALAAAASLGSCRELRRSGGARALMVCVAKASSSACMLS